MKNKPDEKKPLNIAIACGGTGGHLYPGTAIGEELMARGAEVALLVSEKEVDQEAVKSSFGAKIITLSATALQGSAIGFLKGVRKSTRTLRKEFSSWRPDAVIAMGGFTSAPAVLAARKYRAQVFLHEANAIPGRANRLLSHFCHQAFVYFPVAAQRLSAHHTSITGMPVRRAFLEGMEKSAAKMALGFHPSKPLLVVMGGSQGAMGVNDLFASIAPQLFENFHDLQVLLITGIKDFERQSKTLSVFDGRLRVVPFLTEVDLALSAAELAVSRAGASSIAEFAALRVPAILIPYPHAADNHQLANARELMKTGAVCLLEQNHAQGEDLLRMVSEILNSKELASGLSKAISAWHYPDAASDIAAEILLHLSHREAAATKNKKATIETRAFIKNEKTVALASQSK